ncbi:dipeptidase [Okibacterium fritillariae]|uniref:Membrane dipeptidase n=1 Tax=Okibacterium fritillariae TaxID=123320 RepID=A0A1T5K9X9_9MICO|nr:MULTISPECIES: membrane dipeptidase [Microbacteriaceae]ONI61487.1 diguanylate cyclase [Leifsonia sp. ALI-44-B]SKC60493.1 membrane dipeptidase [Okibacterium fritillariae]
MLEPSERYTGYTAYDYLEAGKDYRHFDYAKQIGRVPEYTGLDLSDAEKERTTKLLREETVISLHDHVQVFPEDMTQLRDHIRQGREPTGYEGLSRSGITAVFDNGMDGTCCISSDAGWKYQDVLFDLGVRMADLAHQDFVIKGETIKDIEYAAATGRIAHVFALEASTMIENEVDRLDVLYGFGVRQMGIAYSEANTLGSGLKERGDGGLTYFGERAVERMNKLGIAIDVSHSGDVTAVDAIKASKKPVFITHAGARAVWPTNRMKTDETIVECAKRGGVIGLEAAPHTTLSPKHPRHSIESVMDHFEYCVDLVGLEHVSFGPDTLFGDHVGLHDAFSSNLSLGQAHGAVEYEKVAYVDGLENPAEEFFNIIGWLVKHGYSDDEIRAVVGGNTLRVLKEVWV